MGYEYRKFMPPRLAGHWRPLWLLHCLCFAFSVAGNEEVGYLTILRHPLSVGRKEYEFMLRTPEHGSGVLSGIGAGYCPV